MPSIKIEGIFISKVKVLVKVIEESNTMPDNRQLLRKSSKREEG